LVSGFSSKEKESYEPLGMRHMVCDMPFLNDNTDRDPVRCDFFNPWNIFQMTRRYHIKPMLFCMLDVVLAIWVSIESIWKTEIALDETESF
jgi:hypothetical protein